MKKKKSCACPGPMHNPPCAFRNIGGEATVDFSDLLTVFKKLEKDYSGAERNPARIREILLRLEKIWLKNPDMRLSQLILNFFIDNIMLYYMEDEELIKNLEEMYSGKKKKKKQDRQ